MSWNQRINLTAVTGYEQVQVKHFLDSLTVTLALDRVPPAPEARLRLIDIGAGAGLPGIPLKIFLPEIRLVLVESTAKKASFLQHIVQRLGLESVEVVTARAEEVARLPAYREHFDVALCRAVGKLPVAVELALPFCRTGGIFVAQKKGDIAEELQQAQRAVTELGGRLEAVKLVELPAFAGEKGRLLVIIRKAGPTPELYPRRAGVPAKRPLK